MPPYSYLHWQLATQIVCLGIGNPPALLGRVQLSPSSASFQVSKSVDGSNNGNRMQ